MKLFKTLLFSMAVISLSIFNSCGVDEALDDLTDLLDFSVSISSSTTSLDENGGTATITISFDQINEGDDFTVSYSIDGTATNGTDYETIGSTLTIPNGASQASITITAIDDSDDEEDETIELTIVSATNLITGTNSSITLTIVDDDSTPAPDSSCDGTTDSYSIDLDASNCTETLSLTFAYNESVSGTTRSIESNGIPDHNVGMFPNPGNPNTISVKSRTFEITTNPSNSGSITSLTTGNGQPRYWFGILDNSVVLAPIAAEFFTNTSTGADNTDWNENALSSNISLGTDCNNSHVFPSGRYHHHATPSAFVADRGITSSTTTQIGWAADGYPIYYKYGNKSGSVVELASSYQLKTTERGGDGVSAPSGCPDGTYTQDYEYVAGLGDLDECNGYEDPTLGYIYVITDTYPSIPRCFVGTPSDDFLNSSDDIM